MNSKSKQADPAAGGFLLPTRLIGIAALQTNTRPASFASIHDADLHREKGSNVELSGRINKKGLVHFGTERMKLTLGMTAKPNPHARHDCQILKQGMTAKPSMSIANPTVTI